MAYCIKCGYKNPDTNRFCVACGEPLYTSQPGEQDVPQPPRAPQGKRRKPEKKRPGRWKRMLGIVAVIAVAVWGIGSIFGDDEEEIVSEISFEEADMVSDFQMEDIDWLQDYALYCSLLNQECLKILSNGFHDGEFFTGIGEYSDDRAFNEALQHLIENRENYEAAFSRLEETGFFGDEGSGLLSFNVYGHPHNLAAIPLFTAAAQATGKKPGWLREKFTWLSNKALGFEIDNAEMMSTLREMGAFRDKQIQKDIFESINPENRGGYTNASEFFKALNRDEMMDKRGYMYANILKNLNNESERTYEKWKEAQKSLGCEKEYGDHFMDVAKDLVNDAAKAEMAIIDKLSGGGISNAQKIEEFVENAKGIKKLLKGDWYARCKTKKELKQHLKKLFMDKVREKMPKTGSDAADKFIDYFSEYLENMALEDDEVDEEKARMRAILVVETPEGTKNVVVRDENGKIKVLVPGDDGYAKILSSPGIKLITIVSKDGKRTKTQKVKTKKGKNRIRGKKPKDETPTTTGVNPTASKTEGGESDEPKEGHWKLVDAGVDSEHVTVASTYKDAEITRKPGHFSMSCTYKGNLTISAHPGPCYGESIHSDINFTDPKKYYSPGEDVVITYSTDTSHSEYMCFLPSAIYIQGYIQSAGIEYYLINEYGDSRISASFHSTNGKPKYEDVKVSVSNKMPDGCPGETAKICFRTNDGPIIVYSYVWE